MAKKAAPKSVSKKAASVKKTAAPKAAAAKKTAAPKKAASKSAGPKKAAPKANLKSGAKKDVKLSAGKKAGVKMTPPAKSAAKSPKGKKGVELNVKAAGAAPAVAKPLTKPMKVPKAKKVAAPKNYDDMCREISCESSCSTAGYCRLHYIKNWKKIKRKELILREKKLNQYIEELVSKYPDKYIEAIKQDLSDETAFSKVIYDLELDDSVDDIPSDEDADEQVIDSIKREFDDSDSDF
jgi:hypothetical protein